MKTEMMDFNFDSACTTPYITAPSSPQRFGTTFFFSAPTSPTRISAIYGETNVTHDNDDDCTFEFSRYELDNSSIPAADELFHGGKIKPSTFESRKFKNMKDATEPIPEINELGNDDGRGRERSQNSKLNSSGSSRHKATRSLSPLRDSEKTESSVSSLISLWNRTWKLKDLLLFRSASESRASNSEEELNKYALVKKARQEDTKNPSSSKRRREPISAHELHYKMKREVLKEMKKKTFLPYKQGLLGCSGIDDTISVYMTPRQ